MVRPGGAPAAVGGGRGGGRGSRHPHGGARRGGGWEENGMLAEDRGTLMVLRGEERIGFVSWRKQVTAMTSYCWNIAIGILPEVRGLGYGTEAQRMLVEYLFAHTQVNRVEAMTEV